MQCGSEKRKNNSQKQKLNPKKERKLHSDLEIFPSVSGIILNFTDKVLILHSLLTSPGATVIIPINLSDRKV